MTQRAKSMSFPKGFPTGNAPCWLSPEGCGQGIQSAGILKEKPVLGRSGHIKDKNKQYYLQIKKKKFKNQSKKSLTTNLLSFSEVGHLEVLWSRLGPGPVPV